MTPKPALRTVHTHPYTDESRAFIDVGKGAGIGRMWKSNYFESEGLDASNVGAPSCVHAQQYTYMHSCVCSACAHVTNVCGCGTSDAIS